MKPEKQFLLFLLILFLQACTTAKLSYKATVKQEDFGYPEEKEIEQRFFIIGDGGNSENGKASEGVKAFQYFIDSVDTQYTHALFVGDNIYPAGMPSKKDKNRKEAEHRLAIQVETLEEFEGKTLFIPGNHDWYANGIKGLKDQEDYLKKATSSKKIWAPRPGCGLEIRDITDNITMIIIDSQWFLEDWDKHPTINDDCPERKTREAMFAEIETELKKSQNKTAIIAIHHPLYSNGVHGGKYHYSKHLFPFQKKIPLPGIASLTAQIRATGGVSKQDLQNKQYQSLVARLETLSNKYNNVVYLSGHEHTLQYIEHDGVHQIVSGAGSKASYAGLGDDGNFAYSGQGFAVYDVFRDGSSWVSFYGSKKGLPKLLYQQEVLRKPETDFSAHSSDTVSFPSTVKASVYSSDETKKSTFYKKFWGEHYRELYGMKINAPVALLDTLYGGVEVMRAGGGHQTRSVRVRDSKNREYNVRALKKSAVQFIQAVAFKDRRVEEKFENTIAEKTITDFYTASHPYAFLTIPTLSDAIGLAHTNPKLIYIPKQKALKQYYEDYGNELYMIEERPEEHWLNAGFFGNPNHDIQSTEGLFDRLRRDEKYSLEESEYIKARVFDMLVGDWDRHNDQWRWAEFENEEGKHKFRPIPRDRDQVFSNFDGTLFTTIRGLVGLTRQFGTYNETISDIAWFNNAALSLDRSLLKNSGKAEWIAQAEFIQQKITDEVIEAAFLKLPEEIQQHASTQKIIKTLKKRRQNIVELAERYYNFYTKLSILTATDKDDFIDVTRLPEGKTTVKIWRNKGGNREDLIVDRTFSKTETNEVWIYALDDDDNISVTGKGDNLIFLRIIGGQNNDKYKIKNHKRLKIYDHKSKPNTFDEAGKAKLKLSDHYEQNLYNKDKRMFNTNLILPAVGFNPDDGIKIGVQDVFTHNGFKRNPFTSQHKLRLGYYFATNGYDLEYQGEFARILGNYNLIAGVHFTSPNFSQNFFGYGNDTRNPQRDNDFSFDYNRVKISRIGAEVGLANENKSGSYIAYTAFFESVELDETPNRFLTEEFNTSDDKFYHRKYFTGVETLFRYENYDDFLNPARGMFFELGVRGSMNTEKTNQIYGHIKPQLQFYNPLSKNKKWVLHTKAQSQVNIGNDFEFYQAAQLGGNTGLRAYRNERFTGKSSVAAGADIRYSLGEIQTSFLPFQLGVFAGGDIGRVWTPEHNDHREWHNDIGGGIWVNSAELINGTFNLFSGDDGLRFSFGFGFRF